MKPRRAPFTCPVCGADVSPNAKACPECGSCDKSGWSGDDDSSGLGLPDEDFDYDRFVAEEFGGDVKPAGYSWLWYATAIVLITALAVVTFFH